MNSAMTISYRLQTERLIIDALCAQNLEEVLSNYKHDSKYIQEVYKQHMMPGRIGYGTWLLKLEDTFIGEISLSGPPSWHHEIEIGYHIRCNYRRNGYAYEAISCLIAHLTQHHDKLTIKASALIDNTASQRLLETLDFICTSIDDSYYYYEYEFNGVMTCV